MSQKTIILPEEILRLNRYYTDLWWSSDSGFPRFKRSFSFLERWRNGRKLDQLTDLITRELANLVSDESARMAMRDRVMVKARPFICLSLGLRNEHIDLVLRRKFIEISAEFAARARKFDTSLTDENIYQAARNVMSMNFMQLLLDRKVELTPSVFAYSMLYPLTDNYLDDPAVSGGEKQEFGKNFRLRLLGEKINPRNEHEEALWRLVAMVEGQFERQKHTHLYESLIAIHDAQSRSMAMLGRAKSLDDREVLDISFEKGGTSVLADGYLVAGELSQPQREFTYGYGCFTQLMDDIEDIKGDGEAGIITLFTKAARDEKLDETTNRLFNFGDRFIRQMEQFTSPDALVLRELVWTCTHIALIGSMVASAEYYTQDYLKILQTHYPYPFRALGKQQKKLQENGISITRLVDVMG